MSPPSKGQVESQGGTATYQAQTLDRGLNVLRLLSNGERRTISEIAEELGISRAIVYRLAAVLEEHRLVTRGHDGRLRMGSGVLQLSRAVNADLQSAAAPELAALSERFDATAILVGADGDEAVCLASVEPRGPHVRLAYPPGFRHPLHLTASGMAILAGRDPVEGERPEITTARQVGYAVSHRDLQRIPGVGVSAPISIAGQPADASIAVASLDRELDVEGAGRAVTEAAQRIAKELT